MTQSGQCHQKKLYNLQFPREEGTPHHAGPRGEAPRSVRRQKREERHRPEPLLWFPREEWVRHGRQVWTSLGSWRRQCSICGGARVHSLGCPRASPEGLLNLPVPGFHPQKRSLVWDFFVCVFFKSSLGDSGV